MLAQGAWADRCFPTDVYTRGSDNGSRLLKSFDISGAQGSPLSPIIFPAAIDGAMKATEARYPGVKLTAIQDDTGVLGLPRLMFGPKSNGDRFKYRSVLG